MMKDKKIYKIIFNNRGSAFIYILVIFLLMSILMTTLIVSTVASYKIGKEKGGRNVSYYISDGAVEEFLTEIEEITHRAEVAAIDSINDETSEFWTSDEWTKFNNWIEDKLSIDEITVDQSVEYTEKALKKEFNKVFLTNLLESPTLDTDYTLIDDENKFVEDQDFIITVPSGKGLRDLYVTNLESVEFTPDNFDTFEGVAKPTLDITKNIFSDNKITLTIKTDGTYSKYNKKIEMSVDIIPPEYNYVFKSVIRRKQVFINTIASNAVTSMKDINIFGGSVVFNGNAYAYGTFPENSTYNILQKGGIVVGYDNYTNDYLDLTGEMAIFDSHLSDIEKPGDLTINGNLYTRSNIKIFDDGSKLRVADSAYADGFTVESGSVNGDVSIGKNLYLMDDLFVNGSDTTIKVGDSILSDGQVWTFLDGIDVDGGGTITNKNLSGSIRVSRDVSNNRIELNNLFLSGIVHVGIVRDIGGVSRYYKTGESFTAENNFYFYQSKLADQEDTTDLFEYRDSLGNPYLVVESIDAGGDIEDNTLYKSDHFLTMVRNGVADGNPEIVSTADKNIMVINSIGAGATESDDMKENYTLGVFLGNNKVYNPDYTMDPSTYIDLQKTAIEETDLNINAFQTRDYVNTVNEDGKMDTFIDFTKTIPNSISNTMNLLIYNSDADKDIYINFPSSYSIPSTDISFSDVYEMQGIIATKGNVFIYNSQTDKDFVFNGTIIAGGSVSFVGAGKKIINQNGSVIYGMIINNDDLIDAFHVEDGRKSITAFITGTTKTRSTWGNLDIDVTTNNEEFDLSIKSNPEQIGTSKDDGTKNYEIIYWKEL